MTRSWQSLRCLVWFAVITLPSAHQAVAEADASGNTTSKVFVLPMNGPLYYHVTATELNKVVRAATVQRPKAFVLVISSPGGNRQVAFQIAEQIAEAELANTVAYVRGDYGGAFGPAALVLPACRRVFVAPNNTVDLQPAIREAGDAAGGPVPLSPHQISLLQSWVARSRLPWTPVQSWLAAGGLLGSAEPVAATAPASSPAASHPASAARAGSHPPGQAGLEALRAERADDLQAILQKLGISGARVITWPDPVERTNQTMQRVFQQTDELVKATNNAIAAARQADPRAQRYELRGVAAEYPAGTVVIAPGVQIVTELRPPPVLADQAVFADGGASWRAYTDRCLGFVRQAISANRRLSTLVGLYPELGVDPTELNDSHATLAAWQRQLRAERPLPGPPAAVP
jgi:hypothetical protein